MGDSLIINSPTCDRNDIMKQHNSLSTKNGIKRMEDD